MTISHRPPETPERPDCSFNPARTDALREFLGNARFRGLLAMLVAECRERPAKWRDMHRRGDVAALRAEGHALAVAAASVGAVALGNAAGELERLKVLSWSTPLIDTLEHSARDTLKAAQDLLRQLDAERGHLGLH